MTEDEQEVDGASGDIDVVDAFDLDDSVDLGEDSALLLDDEEPVPGFVSRSFED